MYAALEKSTNIAEDLGEPESWNDTAEVVAWVQSGVERVLGRNVEVGGDLFQQGMDRYVLASDVVSRHWVLMVVHPA
jgi:hypothetical protein